VDTDMDFTFTNQFSIPRLKKLFKIAQNSVFYETLANHPSRTRRWIGRAHGSSFGCFASRRGVIGNS
jgi:hypothetical protein